MDDLAAAAAVVAMTIDDDGEEDLGLEDTLGAAAADDMSLPDEEVMAANKENQGDLPMGGKVRAPVLKVVLGPRTQEISPQSPPMTS